MEERYARTAKLVGESGIEKLRSSTVMIMGVGGVGSYAAEAIARSGVGRIILMDGDEVVESNINRQLVALSSTVGRNKAEVMAERIKDINPDCNISVIPEFFCRNGENGNIFDLADFPEGSWIIDAIDDVDAKVELIKQAVNAGVNIVSAMGAAGKFETVFKSADLAKTSMCPLAKTMRKRLKAEGIEHLPVVYSEEKPVPRDGVLGTMSYVPGSAGLELAAHVIRSIVK
ncbi:MAG: tRNA threonylcarbamoyladenosine dehydratase [Clostridiales bacterium]|nr:tRNA threonylcarbamoyladenosine dehydratase [Candidatus Crickella caballi]